MEYKLIDIAYSALLHDIGKFYQRKYETSNLNSDEISLTPINKDGGYHDHLHSGYTSRFLVKYLNMHNKFERLTSAHHLNECENLLEIIKRSDNIASAIDRKDELDDNDEKNKKGKFITKRLYNVLGEVDFGRERQDSQFALSTLKKMNVPNSNMHEKNVKESAKEYSNLFNEFIKEVESNASILSNINYVSYNYMYNLFNNYLTSIPASTYGGKKSSVSLYDHLKLTSAIASCLYSEECFKENKFYMLEIDVSGIQKFIYKVTEGTDSKSEVAKSLRGRSILVGLLSNAIAYAFLNEFNLTVSNILFNSGGGSTILLPYCKDTVQRIEKVSEYVRKEMFKIFNTDITFVCAYIDVTGEELEQFKSEKAIDLKMKLGRNKMKKFSDLIDKDFFYEKISQNGVCELCGNVSKNKRCKVCNDILSVSDLYTKNTNFGIVYSFDDNINLNFEDRYDFGFVKIYVIESENDIKDVNKVWYIDAINDFKLGNRKMISNLVPLKKGNEILTFSEIVNLTPKNFGDSKLGVLKMDVDNLGGVFAYGLKRKEDCSIYEQRSISKYVTMSRLMELFFGREIENICRDVSKRVNPEISDLVKNETMFYINYAGGDDLAIIGSAYAITQLALEIYNRFSDYTFNKNITISGGIHIQNDKQPIRFGIKEADYQLDLSKLGGKNSITIMNTTVPFNEFVDTLNDVNIIIDYINNEKISRTMLYNIMSFIRDKDFDNYVYTVPRTQYTLIRNISDENALTFMKQQFRNIENKESIDLKNNELNKFVLKLKLVMMFTREK